MASSRKNILASLDTMLRGVAEKTASAKTAAPGGDLNADNGTAKPEMGARAAENKTDAASYTKAMVDGGAVTNPVNGSVEKNTEGAAAAATDGQSGAKGGVLSSVGSAPNDKGGSIKSAALVTALRAAAKTAEDAASAGAPPVDPNAGAGAPPAAGGDAGSKDAQLQDLIQKLQSGQISEPDAEKILQQGVQDGTFTQEEVQAAIAELQQAAPAGGADAGAGAPPAAGGAPAPKTAAVSATVQAPGLMARLTGGAKAVGHAIAGEAKALGGQAAGMGHKAVGEAKSLGHQAGGAIAGEAKALGGDAKSMGSKAVGAAGHAMAAHPTATKVIGGGLAAAGGITAAALLGHYLKKHFGGQPKMAADGSAPAAGGDAGAQGGDAQIQDLISKVESGEINEEQAEQILVEGLKDGSVSQDELTKAMDELHQAGGAGDPHGASADASDGSGDPSMDAKVAMLHIGQDDARYLGKLAVLYPEIQKHAAETCIAFGEKLASLIAKKATETPGGDPNTDNGTEKVPTPPAAKPSDEDGGVKPQVENNVAAPIPAAPEMKQAALLEPKTAEERAARDVFLAKLGMSLDQVKELFSAEIPKPIDPTLAKVASYTKSLSHQVMSKLAELELATPDAK